MNPIHGPRTSTVISLLIFGALCLLPARAMLAADQTQTIESQLRERLRTTMLQLSAAESERAALQATQAQSAEEKKALTEKLEAITKEANASRLAAKAVDTLKPQVARQAKEIAELREAVESGKRAVEVARNQEAERAALAKEVVIGLERLVVDRQEKNLALYTLANEILQRYQKFGLGDALAAREPFVGITRVKLQNLVQDYQDKLQSQRVRLSERDLAAGRDKLALEPGVSRPGQTPK